VGRPYFVHTRGWLVWRRLRKWLVVGCDSSVVALAKAWVAHLFPDACLHQQGLKIDEVNWTKRRDREMVLFRQGEVEVEVIGEYRISMRPKFDIALLYEIHDSLS
jgi:hypothetical protein